MASDTQIAWAAGLFEGEGSTFITGDGNRQPRVTLSMTDEDAVRRFARIVGVGAVESVDPEKYEPGTVRKIAWRWRVQAKDDVLHVLGFLWPYLCERRRQAATEVIERASKMNDGVGYCKRGHDLTLPENLYVHMRTGKRYCRPCRDETGRRRRQRRVA